MSGPFTETGPRLDPHFVYRVYDADDALLYVGCTNNAGRRFIYHRLRSPWFVDAHRAEWEAYPTRLAALNAEDAAILAEEPRHNVRGTPRHAEVVEAARERRRARLAAS